MKHPEYPEYELILATRLKNSINKMSVGMNLDIELKNISINGVKRGCSGFIWNKDNMTIVYVSTEPIYCGYMRRYAESLIDYSGKGGYNMYSKSLDELVKDVVEMLKKERKPTYNGIDCDGNRVYISPY